jgi:uncharacterized membrane protein
MADLINPRPENPTPNARLENLKQLTLIIYILYGLSFFAGVTSLVGIIMNYLKRDEVVGTIYESHFTWQIRTFWWAILWFVIGLITMIVGIGFLVWFAAFVWWLYRMIKGVLNWVDGKPMPMPV